jgi:hypothetical protein
MTNPTKERIGAAGEARPFDTAPRDGRDILALVSGATDRHKHWNGRWFVIRHEGKTVSDFDLGWALFPGFGGVSDRWFSAWADLPTP